MLMGAWYMPPSQINVHGFLTVNGEKMSKSRGTFLNASTFLKYLDPEHFRFYMACRLGSNMDDVDLSFPDFVLRVNADLIGNLVNLISRVATGLLDKFDRKLGVMSQEGKTLQKDLLDKKSEIQQAFACRNYSKAMREITLLGDKVNKYVNDLAPWALIKSDPDKALQVVTDSLSCAKILFTYLAPVLPKIAKEIETLFGIPELNYDSLGLSIENTILPQYTMLSKRVEEKSITMMIEENKPKEQAVVKVPKSQESNLIGIEDLTKVELRVGLIQEASAVEGADKLIQVKVDLGSLGIKNVFAGIKMSYSPEELVGKKVAVVANLKPRQMKFGVSEAMLLASGKDKELSLFVPDRDAKPGDLLK